MPVNVVSIGKFASLTRNMFHCSGAVFPWIRDSSTIYGPVNSGYVKRVHVRHTPTHTYTNPSVLVLDFGGDKTSTAGDFTVIFPTPDASNAILRLA